MCHLSLLLGNLYLLVYDEHRYLGAVLAGIEDLAGLKQGAIKTLHLNLTKHLDIRRDIHAATKPHLAILIYCHYGRLLYCARHKLMKVVFPPFKVF